MLKKQYHSIKGSGLGKADYFDNRHKYKMLSLVNAGSDDTFYDLGCGDASILVYAVKYFKVKLAVGYEVEYHRLKKAYRNVLSSDLTADDIGKIILNHQNFLHLSEAELNKADIILNMHMEFKEDYELLFSKITRPGIKIIKHDLPIIGYIPDIIDHPFYIHRTPLRKAKSKEEWCPYIGFKNEQELWHELYYYQYQKGYTKNDIRRFDKMLNERIISSR